jgi:hypothetical protein
MDRQQIRDQIRDGIRALVKCPPAGWIKNNQAEVIYLVLDTFYDEGYRASVGLLENAAREANKLPNEPECPPAIR